MKAYSVFLFLASFLIISSLLFSISGCTPRQEQKPEPPKQAKITPPAIKPNALISVDFDNMALSSVAQFVTAQTGKGFILSGNEAKPITWMEANMAKEKIFDSFKATITASGLLLKAMNEQETLFTIEKPEESKVAYQLNFASSRRGTFFLLGSTVYPLEKFPFPVRFDAGHWYAMLPRSTADQLTAAKQPEKAPM